MAEGSPVVVHRFTTTPHVGAHADAPAHFRRDGASIDAVPLEPYLGPCQVVHCLGRTGPVVTLAEVQGAGPDSRIGRPSAADPDVRVLPDGVAGRLPRPGPPRCWPGWPAKAAYWSGRTAPRWTRCASTAMAAHHAAADHGIAILENLCLDAVAGGPLRAGRAAACGWSDWTPARFGRCCGRSAHDHPRGLRPRRTRPTRWPGSGTSSPCPTGVIYLDGNSLGARPKVGGRGRPAGGRARSGAQDLIGSWNTAGWFDLPGPASATGWRR